MSVLFINIYFGGNYSKMLSTYSKLWILSFPNSIVITFLLLFNRASLSPKACALINTPNEIEFLSLFGSLRKGRSFYNPLPQFADLFDRSISKSLYNRLFKSPCGNEPKDRTSVGQLTTQAEHLTHSTSFIGMPLFA